MARSQVWHRRKSYKVKGEVWVGRKKYLILKKLTGDGSRLQVFDPQAGPDGDLRAVHVYPRSDHVMRQLRVLKRVSETNSNLPTILEYHPKKGSIQVVLTWVDGTDLKVFLDGVRHGKRHEKQRQPSPREAVRLVRGLAHGVSNLNHRKNIVHGDLKPANLVLTRDPTRLVMIDFGSAWFVEKATSWPASHTPGYGSPEQLADESERAVLGQPDFRSDQFSVSVIFYELLTMRLPYDGVGGMAGVSESDRTAFGPKLQRPSRLSNSTHGLPLALWRQVDRLVTRGLALLPNERFPNRSEWLGEFDHLHAELKRLDRGSVFHRSIIHLLELPFRMWQRHR